MLMINVGCGEQIHPEWTNLDLVSHDKRVRAIDVRRGLPFPDQSCDVAYSSHMLEHLSPQEASRFLRECFRILKPGGIIRIVVPNLEAICRAYLDSLERVRMGQPGAEHDHDWMVLELVDQMVRDASGGEMARMLAREIPNEDFVFNRIGEYGRHIAHTLKSNTTRPWRTRSLFDLLLKQSGVGRRLLAGSFQLSGERHRWMYD